MVLNDKPLNNPQFPLISIIIPTFNAGRTISRCLKSILTQEYSHYEILIIDALSTDDTIQIVRACAENCACLRWESEKDAGIYDAMNKGILKARGEWLYFLGGDDALYSENTLLEVSRHLCDVDVIYGDVYSPRFNGRYAGEFDALKIKDMNICHQAIFFHRKVFEKTGLFDLAYKAHSDWDHNLKWFLSKDIKRKYISTIIANYADNGFSSISGDRRFHYIKHWKYSVLTKESLTFAAKLKLVGRELMSAFRTRRFVDLCTIIVQTPSFFFHGNRNGYHPEL